MQGFAGNWLAACFWFLVARAVLLRRDRWEFDKSRWKNGIAGDVLPIQFVAASLANGFGADAVDHAQCWRRRWG